MPELLLTLVVPGEVAEAVEDLLLEHPERVAGFTTLAAAGHGAAVRLVAASERVSGHAPRRQVEVLGEEDQLRAVLDLLRRQLPHANIYYWLTPVLESGRLG